MKCPGGVIGKRNRLRLYAFFRRAGSNPALGTNGHLAQGFSASRLHREGRGSESLSAHHDAAVAQVVERTTENR